MPALTIAVTDPPELWADLGFTLEGPDADRCRIGTATTILLGRTGDRVSAGTSGWAVPAPGGAPELTAEVDGLPHLAEPANTTALQGPPPLHPNGITGLDHAVVLTPDLDRTIDAVTALGFDLRRVREMGQGRRQAFFWIGDVILEVVGPDGRPPSEPSSFGGLAFVSADLDATASFLGDRGTAPKPAVQKGRRILALTRAAGSAVPIAVMSAHT